MAILVSLPILSGLLVFQSAIISQIPLLRGTADLVLLAVVCWSLQKRVQTAWQWSIIAGLLVSIVSALPLGVALIAYPLAAGATLILRQRVWHAPILALFMATFLGTLITHAVFLTALRISGDPLPVQDVLNLITLPSLLLNLLLAFPMNAVLGDLANWLYPVELEV